MNDNQLQTEYEYANRNIHHFSNLKLAEVTVYIVIQGGLMGALFNTDIGRQAGTRTVLEYFGLICSLCFIGISESTHYAIFHFIKRAIAIENHLNYKLWSKLPGAPSMKWKPSCAAARIIYILVVIFWIVTLCHGFAFMGVGKAKSPN